MGVPSTCALTLDRSLTARLSRHRVEVEFCVIDQCAFCQVWRIEPGMCLPQGVMCTSPIVVKRAELMPDAQPLVAVAGVEDSLQLLQESHVCKFTIILTAEGGTRPPSPETLM